MWLTTRSAAIAALFVCALAGHASAETRVDFYSHGWGTGPDGFVYFPHAFLALSDQGGSPRTYGFTAGAGAGVGALIRATKGEVQPADPRYISKSRLHFTVTIPDAEAARLEAWIAQWAADDRYDLRRRNCISFIAGAAEALGLATPPKVSLDPAVVLEAIRRLNALPTPGGEAEPATVSPPLEATEAPLAPAVP